MAEPIMLGDALTLIDYARKHHAETPGVASILISVQLADSDWHQAIKALSAYAEMQTWVIERRERTALSDSYDCLEWAGKEKKARARLMALADALDSVMKAAGDENYAW